MPSLKQPGLLRDEAMAVLDEISYEFCRMCHSKGSTYKLREGIAYIKTQIGPHMPQNLAVVFYNELFERCSSLRDHPDLPRTTFLRIVLEAVMDERMLGLVCTPQILEALHPEDSNRLRGFTELRMYGHIEPYSLRKLYLGNLTTFKYQSSCTDLDLVIIGHYCPKLTYIDVSGSGKVTDVGLCALGLCSNLRSVDVSLCDEVSVAGLKNLLLVNLRISEVFGWEESADPGFDYFEDPDWASDISVHPSIESFTIARHKIGDRHTRFLVAKFPNLTWIKLDGELTGDVCILNSLKKLSKIDLRSNFQTDKILSLLKYFGAQIEHMMIEVTQSLGLNLIFELCKNLEHLYFIHDFERDDHLATLVVPPFQKLKSLICVSLAEEETPKLELGQMLQLERLEISEFPMSRSELKSIILDHTNFPNLKIMSISKFGEENDLVHLRHLAKTRHLDFELHHIEQYYY